MALAANRGTGRLDQLKSFLSDLHFAPAFSTSVPRPIKKTETKRTEYKSFHFLPPILLVLIHRLM